MSNITHIYEAVDQTNDEMFFPVGVFLTLNDAVSAIMEHAADPCQLDDADQSVGGYFTVNIHKRKLGVSGIGPCVNTFRWEKRYIEADDSYTWDFEHRQIEAPSVQVIGKYLAEKNKELYALLAED